MKYVFTPLDIASFLRDWDIPASDRQAFIDGLWEHDRDILPRKYRKDKAAFERFVSRVDYLQRNLEKPPEDLKELNAAIRENDTRYDHDEAQFEGEMASRDLVDTYFKAVWLELSFRPGRMFRKIKFRRLLKGFGSNQRSLEVMDKIKRALDGLDLRAYLKQFEPCDLDRIRLDETIIIRLMLSASRWDYIDGQGKRRGPIRFGQLRELAAQGMVKPDTPIIEPPDGDGDGMVYSKWLEEAKEWHRMERGN